MGAAESSAERARISLSTPHVPRADRAGRISPTRDIACRRCGRWMRYGEAGPWRHNDDGTLACVDPLTLDPYPEPDPEGAHTMTEDLQ